VEDFFYLSLFMFASSNASSDGILVADAQEAHRTETGTRQIITRDVIVMFRGMSKWRARSMILAQHWSSIPFNFSTTGA